ncbi:hypothetical protein [Streptomyces sp. NPDC001978]|uniref:hypothetical protein n=1 Tax=Streptomyces sp. NPDC001978 TaxID=3364627 RepID=UPI0036C3B94D
MFTSLLVALADDPSVVLPAPAAPVVGDAVAAVVGFAAAARSRLSMPFRAHLAAGVGGPPRAAAGAGLATTRHLKSINTSWP